jgi:Helix-turn-helix domain
MKSPAVSDLSSLPVILTLKEIAAIYRVSLSTIRRGLQNGTFSPRPWDRYPYRWRRDDVAAGLNRRRGERPQKPHGFAATRTRRPAKATLDPLPTRVRSAR